MTEQELREECYLPRRGTEKPINPNALRYSQAQMDFSKLEAVVCGAIIGSVLTLVIGAIVATGYAN